MTEPMDELDRRATRAAEELRDVAASRPRPDLTPDRATTSTNARSSNRAPRLLAIAAVLALIVGAAVMLWPRDDEAENIIAGPVGEIPGHILDPTPDGFTAMGMDREDWGPGDEDATTSGVAIELQPWHLYGPVGERARLGIIVGPEGFDEVRPNWPEIDEAEVFDLAGRRAYRDEEDLGVYDSNAVVVEVDDVAVAVFGGVDTEVVDAVAATVTVTDGVPVVDPDSLPEGWEAGDIVEPESLGMGYGDPSATKIVFYLTEELDPQGPGFTMIQVVTGTGPVEAPVDLAGLFPTMDGQQVDEVEVNGNRAFLLTNPGGTEGDVGIHSIAWEPEPDLSVSLYVYGYDLTHEDVIGLAETVRAATPEEWQELLDRSEDQKHFGGEMETETAESGDDSEQPLIGPTTSEGEPHDGPIPDMTVAGAGGTRGVSWEARIENGWLFIRTGDGDVGDGTPAELDQPLPIATTDPAGDGLLAGVIPAEHEIRIEIDGTRGKPDWVEEISEGHRLWVAEVPQRETVTVELLDRDGNTLATRTLIQVGGL